MAGPSTADLWRWRAGRQGTGYERLLLAATRWPLPCDAWLLRFRPGTGVPPHVDPARPGTLHYRLNIYLRRARKGGEFEVSECIARGPRFALFRPDVATHAVHRVEEGTRVVLSIGWLRRAPPSPPE